jgi:outer membrane biosynthesis protein TonB
MAHYRFGRTNWQLQGDLFEDKIEVRRPKTPPPRDYLGRFQKGISRKRVSLVEEEEEDDVEEEEDDPEESSEEEAEVRKPPKKPSPKVTSSIRIQIPAIDKNSTGRMRMALFTGSRPSRRNQNSNQSLL